MQDAEYDVDAEEDEEGGNIAEFEIDGNDDSLLGFASAARGASTATGLLGEDDSDDGRDVEDDAAVLVAADTDEEEEEADDGDDTDAL